MAGNGLTAEGMMSLTARGSERGRNAQHPDVKEEGFNLALISEPVSGWLASRPTVMVEGPGSQNRLVHGGREPEPEKQGPWDIDRRAPVPRHTQTY